MIWHGVWRAIVEAHERELMMQRKREGGWLMGRPMPLGPGEIPPQFGGYQPVAPADIMARHQRLAQAMASERRTDIEDAIRAYARKLLRDRAAIVRSERITRTVHEMIRAAGGEPS